MSWKSDLVRCTLSPLHIYNRGVDGMTIFRSEYDYAYWINLMAEYLPDYQLRLLVHGLMPNHYHIACKQEESYEVSGFAHDVSWRYAKYFNKKYSRRGPVFAGRFVPKLVKDDAGLLRLSHYIHMNPVAAGLVKHPQDWPYSSLGCYGNGESESLIYREPIWKLVGGPAQYIEFLKAYDPADPDSILKFLRKINGRDDR
jgi:putative transposase